ncbi:hypothetical protein GTW43_25680 [Streptomyces sp. SID5785]|uniref:hypothetical protein n=1 Tax=Streptomyces sp. SID5785 TaxID=2690309 RepID=UPI001361A4B8|nr:hypothetical protein [Streptomyces sp. SID5785]MZD04689.1 hypothetical protein [Streptomyces sp. SID5785]MZD08442.1 hypothetical protein [Streptomyces sp. SID5785]
MCNKTEAADRPSSSRMQLVATDVQPRLFTVASHHPKAQAASPAPGDRSAQAPHGP